MPNKKKEKKMKKPKIAGEFKKFITRGNILDMSVGVIIGGAFGKIVASLVADIIMPPINLLISSNSMNEMKWILRPAVDAVVDSEGVESVSAVSEIAINFGNFIHVVLDFLLIAICVFLMIKVFMKMRERMEKLREIEIERRRTDEERAKIEADKQAHKDAEEAAKNAPVPSTTEELLTQIRDLLVLQSECKNSNNDKNE